MPDSSGGGFVSGNKAYNVNPTSQDGIARVTAKGISPLYTNIVHHLQHLQNVNQTKIVDFTVINLDPVLALDILGLFEEINEGGTTVIFATHDRTLLEVSPRRLVVIDDGRCIEARAGLAGLGGVLDHGISIN